MAAEEFRGKRISLRMYWKTQNKNPFILQNCDRALNSPLGFKTNAFNLGQFKHHQSETLFRDTVFVRVEKETVKSFGGKISRVACQFLCNGKCI